MTKMCDVFTVKNLKFCLYEKSMHPLTHSPGSAIDPSNAKGLLRENGDSKKSNLLS